MIVYLSVIFMFLLLTYKYSSNEKSRNLILWTYIITLFFLMGLRSIDIGTDTRGYCNRYILYGNLSWREIFGSEFSIGDSSYGFFALNKIAAILFKDHHTLYLLLVSAIISYALFKFLKYFSEDYFTSVVMLFALGNIFFFMSGIKQTLAIAFVLLAYIELYENKTMKFILLIVLAATFHNTAIIALIAWPIYKYKHKKHYFILIPLAIASSLIFRSHIVRFFQSMVSEGKYAVYGGTYVAQGTMMGFYIQLVILLFTLLVVWHRLKTDEHLVFFVTIYSIGLFFQGLSPIIAEFFRISMYFNIVGCVMLAYALKFSRVKPKKFVSIAVLSFLVFYFIISNYSNQSITPYHFFW